MDGIMDGEFLDQFKCPICYKIPEKEIFQCRNGHTICNVCIENLSLCPLCRVSLGSFRIRSRPLEEILDKQKFDCSFKQEGCTTKVSRKEITNHSENCLYGGLRVPLCKFLGHTCSHEVNARKLHETLDHFQQEHQYWITDYHSLGIRVKDLKNLARQKRCLWKPIIVNAFNNHYLLVTCAVERNIFFTCISFDKTPNDKVQVKFCIVPTDKNAPMLEWTTKPISHEQSELVFKSPPYQFPLKLITEKYLEQCDLTINVTMSKKNFRNPLPSRIPLTVDSFAVLQRPCVLQTLQWSIRHLAFYFGRIIRAIGIRFVTTLYSCFNILHVKTVIIFVFSVRLISLLLYLMY